MAREVDEQRDVRVGQRRRDEAPAQQGEPGPRVRPRPQPVPGGDETVTVGVAERADAVLGERLVERLAVHLSRSDQGRARR